MTIKRLILILLTIVAIAKVFLSLVGSISQPQVQSRLELYQSNFILYATELTSSQSEMDVATALIGTKPYANVQKQYQQARQEAVDNVSLLQAQLDKLSSQLVASSEPVVNPTPDIAKQQQLQKTIVEGEKFIAELDLKLGILQAQQEDRKSALQTWTQLSNNTKGKEEETANILTGLWSIPPNIAPNTEKIIQTNLDGWFRDQTLEQLYQLQKRQEDLLNLTAKQQQIASIAVLKLALIGAIPLLGGIIGVILLVVLLIDLLMKKEQAILATNNNEGWTTPWDGEIIWQVLIVGFFFISEILLPFIFGLFNFNPTGLSLRFKAVYVLVSYMMMAFGGLLVLYFSVKPFKPLPQDWFKVKLLDNWFIWGLGGYLVAVPLVVVVSLINQQIWHGQGGSNPLLTLALQSQDKVALAIFFGTAAIAAPIFEEIIFRGFLLASLTRYLPVGGAIVISSLIFAIAHLSVSEILPLTTLGIVLGFVYTRSRNLLASMFLHSLWNSGTLLSLFILGSGIN